MTESQIITGDCQLWLPEVPAGSVHSCITSPPYWTGAGSLGCASPSAYLMRLAACLQEVRRTLDPTCGHLWLVLGDSTRERAGHDPLLGMPWQVVRALCDLGWQLLAEVAWQHGLPVEAEHVPSGQHDRVFLLAPQGVRPMAFATERMADLGSVISAPTTLVPGSSWHPLPGSLVRTLIRASTQPDQVVLDPFCGSGNVGLWARRTGRTFIGGDIDPEVADLARERAGLTG